jgi:DNA-binding NarL/FixJ family response regulator
LAQSAEKLEQCVRAMQELSSLVDAILSSSGGKDEQDNRQASFSYIAPNAPPGNGHSVRGDPATTSNLTRREVQIVTLLADSKSNKEISNLLDITAKTVDTHRTRIMSKLQIHSISELVLYAVRNHLIKP